MTQDVKPKKAEAEQSRHDQDPRNYQLQTSPLRLTLNLSLSQFASGLASSLGMGLRFLNILGEIGMD